MKEPSTTTDLTDQQLQSLQPSSSATASVENDSRDDPPVTKHAASGCYIPFSAKFWCRRLVGIFVLLLVALTVLSLVLTSPATIDVKPLSVKPNAAADYKSTHTVIVGAGAAGLFAGYTLQYLGMSNFTILEASNDFGGRVKEISNFVDVPLDLGAEWIHGAPQVLQDLLLYDENPDDKPLPETMVYQPQTYQGTHGRRDWARFFYSEYKFRKTTWHGYLRDFIHSYVQKNMQLNAVVDTIDYSDSNGMIQVITRDGTVYAANKVIMATPVSAFQQRLIGFVPPLPSAKEVAMDKIEFPPGLKVWLEFSKRFYADMVIPGRVLTVISSEKMYFDAVWGKKEYTDRHVLALFHVGPSAWESVQMSDEGIVQAVLKQLDRMFDGQASKYLLQTHVQNWSKEPFIQGSYSYNYGQVYDHIPKITEPLDQDRIYFCGEHTIRDHPATVHGAALSGRRTAERLVQDILGDV